LSFSTRKDTSTNSIASFGHLNLAGTTAHFHSTTFSPLPVVVANLLVHPVSTYTQNYAVVDFFGALPGQIAIQCPRPGLQAALQHAAADSSRTQIVLGSTHNAFFRPQVHHPTPPMAPLPFPNMSPFPSLSALLTRKSTAATASSMSAVDPRRASTV
jgi:hypothetical protein